MKRIGSWLMSIMLLCVPLSAFAEVSASDSMYLTSAVLSMEEWCQGLSEMAVAESTEDEVFMLNAVQNTLLLSEVVLLKAMDEGPALEKGMQELLPRELSCRDNGRNAFCQTPVMWIDDMGIYVLCDTVTRDAYLSVLMSLYQEDGAYLGSQRVEIAQRDGQTVMLIVDYDNTMCFTGRFAMRWDGERGEIIYTKTLGMNLDIVLDVSAWQSGEDIQEWTKNLLLPRQ